MEIDILEIPHLIKAYEKNKCVALTGMRWKKILQKT